MQVMLDYSAYSGEYFKVLKWVRLYVVTRPRGVQPVFDMKDLLIFGASVSFLTDFIVPSYFFLKELNLSLEC